MADLKLPSKLDPSHNYIFRSGEYGPLYQYWYQDRAGNYWKYSNAPTDHQDFDPLLGEPILDGEQTFPHANPEFFSPEGYRRHMAPPPESTPMSNEEYDPNSLESIWAEYYLAPSGDSIRYLYLDRDCKENLDLYIQHQIRVVDAGLVKYRKWAAEQFMSSHDKSKTVACILMLVDQAYYTIEELSEAKVADLSFIDDTVYLLGKKFRCDPTFLDYLSSKVIGRAIDEYLFMQDTINGREPLGLYTLYSTFAYLRVSPVFLKYWHATNIYSKIVNRYALLKVPEEEVEAKAYLELSHVLNTTEDVRFLVDHQVSNTLLRAYSSAEAMQKSLLTAKSDNFGVHLVDSSLVTRKQDEQSFSVWLHSTPLHALYEGSTAEEEVSLQEAVPDPEEEGEEGTEDSTPVNDADAMDDGLSDE